MVRIVEVIRKINKNAFEDCIRSPMLSLFCHHVHYEVTQSCANAASAEPNFLHLPFFEQCTLQFRSGE